MTSPTPREILEAFKAAITAAATTIRPWHQVSLPGDLYESLVPEIGEPEAHFGFAVSAPQSPGQPVQGRGTLMVATEIVVHWSRILGAERQVEDYSTAFDDERALLLVLDRTALARNPTYKNATRKVLSGQSTGLVYGRITLSITHAYPLS